MNSLQKVMQRINKRVNEAKDQLDSFYLGDTPRDPNSKSIYRPIYSKHTGPDGNDPKYVVFGADNQRCRQL